MSWDNCKKCVFMPRSSFTSALFKVLITLKLLHGSRSGARGSSLEDIAMHMIKYFCLDGDVKSQVLASLKYGVKMHFIQKRKEKFSLILPASSIHLAPCKFKNEEIERIHCIFPAKWESNACNDTCSKGSTCCGKRKHDPRDVCCCQDRIKQDPCDVCQSKRKRGICPDDKCAVKTFKKSNNICSKRCNLPPIRNKCKKKPICPTRKKRCRNLKRRNYGRCPQKDDDDDICQLCGFSSDEDNGSRFRPSFKNCKCCVK